MSPPGCQAQIMKVQKSGGFFCYFCRVRWHRSFKNGSSLRNHFWGSFYSSCQIWTRDSWVWSANATAVQCHPPKSLVVEEADRRWEEKIVVGDWSVNFDDGLKKLFMSQGRWKEPSLAKLPNLFAEYKNNQIQGFSKKCFTYPFVEHSSTHSHRAWVIWSKLQNFPRPLLLSTLEDPFPFLNFTGPFLDFFLHLRLLVALGRWILQRNFADGGIRTLDLWYRKAKAPPGTA